MTKKFVSLVLSLALVIGLLPIMSVSATENSAVKILYKEDFTNFDLTSFNENYDSSTNQYTVSDKDGNARFSTGKLLRTDIINMPGYDGTDTNVIKVILDPPTKTSISSSEGLARMAFSGLSTALGTVNGGALIYEFKMYIPEADSSGNKKDINSFSMAPIVKNGDNFSVGTSASGTNNRKVITSPKPQPGNWYDFKYVMLLDENSVLVYCNDELVSYKQKTVSTKGYQIQMQSMRDADDEHIIFDDLKVWHIAAKSTEDASPKGITSATSFYDDRANVPVATNPTVDFTNMILNDEDANHVVSNANVVMTKSDGTTVVPLTSVTVGADKKSIVIVPTDGLEKGMKYNVKVTGLYDMFEELIPEYNFSFTTVEPSSITISQPVFTKENLFVAGGASQTLTELENGYIKSAATVNNSANAAKEVMVLAMLKEGNDIKYFQFKNITVPAKGSVAFTAGFQVDDANSQKIETVVWDSIYNKIPLADKYEFSSSGYVKTDLDTLLGE